MIITPDEAKLLRCAPDYVKPLRMLDTYTRALSTMLVEDGIASTKNLDVLPREVGLVLADRFRLAGWDVQCEEYDYASTMALISPSPLAASTPIAAYNAIHLTITPSGDE